MRPPVPGNGVQSQAWPRIYLFRFYFFIQFAVVLPIPFSGRDTKVASSLISPDVIFSKNI